jgi:hydrogenase-4 component B
MTLILLALVLLAVAVLADLIRLPHPSWLIAAAASVVLVVAGGRGVAGHAGVLRLGGLGGLGPATLRIDPLSGLFLIVAFAVAVPVLLAGTAQAARPVRPRLAALVAVTLAAVLVIVTADNAFVLLFGWEALTFAFYLLAGFDRSRPGSARAAVATVTFGKISGAALLVGLLLLAGHAHTFVLARLGLPPGAAHDAAYALLLFGFAVKVGMVPVQVWLPPGYAAAPGPARAVMAAVAVNVGFYGMWRTLDVLGRPPVWLVVTVLLVAGATALLGIAHAAVHADLTHLVAWSSVENAGLISAGFGVALVGAAAGDQRLVAAGLLAGTLQVCAHALGKALLFVTTATIEQAAGTSDLDELRGIARQLPWAGTGLVVGSLTLAGLPLTAGFASEWFTLESLMQQFRLRGLAMQLSTAAAGALVALTVGVAGVTFVRVVALTAFGHPTTMPASGGADRRLLHRAAVGLLVAGCLGVAAVAPLEVRLIAHGVAPIAGDAGLGALASPWVLQPVYPGFSVLSPSWLWIALPSMFTLVAVFAIAASGGRLLRVRRVPAWTSASAGTDRTMQYTSFGYANPMRKVLANLLLTRSELRRAELRTGGRVGDEASGAAGVHLGYTTDVVEVVERYLYRPLGRVLFAAVRAAKRLQSGRLDAYMGYMLLALLAVLAVVAVMA